MRHQISTALHMSDLFIQDVLQSGRTPSKNEWVLLIGYAKVLKQGDYVERGAFANMVHNAAEKAAGDNADKFQKLETQCQLWYGFKGPEKYVVPDKQQDDDAKVELESPTL